MIWLIKNCVLQNPINSNQKRCLCRNQDKLINCLQLLMNKSFAVSLHLWRIFFLFCFISRSKLNLRLPACCVTSNTTLKHNISPSLFITFDTNETKTKNFHVDASLCNMKIWAAKAHAHMCQSSFMFALIFCKWIKKKDVCDEIYSQS